MLIEQKIQEQLVIILNNHKYHYIVSLQEFIEWMDDNLILSYKIVEINGVWTLENKNDKFDYRPKLKDEPSLLE